MSNITVQREVSPQASAIGRYRDWDPFRAMRELMQWQPLSDFSPNFRALEATTFAPDFDVKETKEGFVFRADVPGVKDADLDVRITQNRLSVSGKRESEKTEKGETFYATERSYGSFTRSFTLPEGVDADKVKADLKEGVLTLMIPKKPEVQPKKIEVSSK